MSCSVCFAEPKRFSSSRVIAESLDPVALYRDTVADAGAPAAADWSVHRRGGSVAIEWDAMPRDARAPERDSGGSRLSAPPSPCRRGSLTALALHVSIKRPRRSRPQVGRTWDARTGKRLHGGRMPPYARRHAAPSSLSVMTRTEDQKISQLQYNKRRQGAAQCWRFRGWRPSQLRCVRRWRWQHWSRTIFRVALRWRGTAACCYRRRPPFL